MSYNSSSVNITDYSADVDTRESTGNQNPCPSWAKHFLGFRSIWRAVSFHHNRSFGHTCGSTCTCIPSDCEFGCFVSRKRTLTSVPKACIDMI